jgi:hypothetical protein
MRRNWNPHALLVVTQNSRATLENSEAVPQKKIKLSSYHMPQQLHSHIYTPRKLKTYVHTKTYTQILIAAIFMVAKKSKNNLNIHQLLNEQTKYGIIFIMEYYSAIKKNGVIIHAMMNDNLILNESQTQKVTKYMIPFI